VIITPRAASVADLHSIAGPPRSDGLHVSTVLKSILLALDPERFGGEMDLARIELGFAVERLIERAFAERQQNILRIGELEKDGISGSPDGVSFSEAGDDEMIIHEIKCTWMSMTGCPEHKKFWHWLAQIKAYCYLAETHRARLHVFFINGNYKDQRSPQYAEWDLLFHDGELAENWAMLTNAATALRR
jgi:hypothetical protein